MSQRHVLAIDQGTTGTTALVFDQEGAIRGRAYSEFQQHYPKPGRIEHDPEAIWDGCVDLMGRALADAGIRPTDLEALGITNQRETTVLWDRETGRPVHNAIVWQDRRTAGFCDELKAQGHEPTIRGKTGLVVDPYFSGTKIRWLLENVEGLRDRAERGEIAFGTIDSWLLWKLTGGAVHATDDSNASRTLLYNIHELRWDPELLDLLGVPEAVLPAVHPSSGVFGSTAPGILDGAEVPVAGIAGDQQAALFGQACYGAGLAKNTYGTGSFVLMNTGDEAVRSETGLLTTIAWGFADGTVEYALEGAIFVTGAAVQWLRDGLGLIRDAAETEDLARSLDSNEGVYFVPALTGLGAPHWDPYARGTIVGLTRGTSRAHLARATLESMAYQTRDVLDAMRRDAGVPLRELRADGGAVGNAFLMQFQADVVGVPVEVPRITQTTALGAAYLAGLGTGFWESRGELDAKWQRAERYEPRMSAAERDRLHGRWLEAVERARHWERDESAREGSGGG